MASVGQKHDNDEHAGESGEVVDAHEAVQPSVLEFAGSTDLPSGHTRVDLFRIKTTSTVLSSTPANNTCVSAYKIVALVQPLSELPSVTCSVVACRVSLASCR